MKLSCFSIAAIVLTVFSGFGVNGQSSPKREFRGVWVASVVNIDWPSKPGLTSAEQRQEFIDLLEMHKANGMNAVVVQVRPAADAFYPSTREPWSKWLSGQLGQPPSPYYDPLHFMIEETHKRAMEFHAWFNPYRAVMNVDTAQIDEASIVHKHRSWFVKYDKHLYFDPGLPQAQQHVLSVILDVVNRYDIDGVHFDDYFYPYKVEGLTFPDSATFARYGQGFDSIDDWRRDNVNKLIKSISDSIRQVKPQVRFGISPFGVWRNQDKDPNGSATRAGQTCYDDLYADVLMWMKAGWIDYVAPQIYWTIGFDRAPYEVIAKWWNANSHGVLVFIGHGVYRIGNHPSDSSWMLPSQVPMQIRLNRSLENIKGSIHFSSKSFKPNPLGISDTLAKRLYNHPALYPAEQLPSLGADYKITFYSDGHGIELRWQDRKPEERNSSSRYVVYRFADEELVDLSNTDNILAILPNTNRYAAQTQIYKDASAKRNQRYTYVITILDAFRRELTPDFAYPVKYKRKSWHSYTKVKIK